jgi:hypothetical protein
VRNPISAANSSLAVHGRTPVTSLPILWHVHCSPVPFVPPCAPPARRHYKNMSHQLCFAGFPARVARQRIAAGVDVVHTGRRRTAQAMVVTSFRRRDRPHWLQPQGSSQRLMVVDHGRFVAAIEHMGLRP